MTRNRLEAFSDGVLAIIITIMVLELKAPRPRLILCCSRPSLPSKGRGSRLKAAIGRDWKGKLSPVLYGVGILSTFWWRPLALALYVFVALLWLVPDRRIERSLGADDASKPA